VKSGQYKWVACANSLRAVGIAAEDLTAGVTTVPAAVTHLAQRLMGRMGLCPCLSAPDPQHSPR